MMWPASCVAPSHRHRPEGGDRLVGVVHEVAGGIGVPHPYDTAVTATRVSLARNRTDVPSLPTFASARPSWGVPPGR